MLVFLGPDGSGKSSVINRIIPDLAPAFRKNQYMHLRPNLGRNHQLDNMPVTNPHGQAERSWLLSVLKVFYFIFDYCMGYLLKIHPMLVRSNLVIFDRYYHDLLVDPKRYRYGGPMRFARLLGNFVPKPDLFIFLDAPAKTFQSRKKEVSFKEAVRQRRAYLELAQNMENAVVVDAAQTIEKVVTDTKNIVIAYMSERAKKPFEW